MRASAATGEIDFGVLNDFFSRVLERALGGSSPVRRWRPPTGSGSSGGSSSSAAATNGNGGDDGGSGGESGGGSMNAV